MKYVKDRTLSKNQLVHVYYNLHQGGFSIRDKKTGLVVAYAETLKLENATFKVSEKGRQHVIREQRKRVHAFVEGEFIWGNQELPDLSEYQTVYYNPYLTPYFTIVETNAAVYEAKEIIFKGKGCLIR